MTFYQIEFTWNFKLAIIYCRPKGFTVYSELSFMIFSHLHVNDP